MNRNITKEKLEELVSNGLSTTEIGKIFNLSQTGIRHYLNKYGLKTIPSWNHKNKFSDEQVLNIWNKSDSFNQFLLNLEVGQSGGAWYHYKKRLEKLGINVDFNDGKSKGGLKTAKQRNAESIKKRQRLQRPCLKKAMDLAGIPYKCNNSKCGVSEWQGKKLKLHIHHKDEDKTNNIISNLEYLCPNCHGIFHYIED